MAKGKKKGNGRPPDYEERFNEMAYIACKGNKWCVVVNGNEGKEYDGIVSHSLVFSPDSSRLGYAAAVGKKQLAIVDGDEGNLYEGIGLL